MKEKAMTKIQRDEMKKFIAADLAAQAKQEWKCVGVAAMDAAMLTISDPCYTLQPTENGTEPEFSYKDCCGPYPGDPDYTGDAKQLNFKRGHAGAGVVVHSPHGDGAVTIWAKMDGMNRVRAVFFSFDDESPVPS